jgi:hypothetical protein
MECPCPAPDGSEQPHDTRVEPVRAALAPGLLHIRGVCPLSRHATGAIRRPRPWAIRPGRPAVPIPAPAAAAAFAGMQSLDVGPKRRHCGGQQTLNLGAIFPLTLEPAF